MNLLLKNEERYNKNINHFEELEQDIQRVSVKYLPRYIDILSYTNNKNMQNIFWG